jgi:hypothetical protein
MKPKNVHVNPSSLKEKAHDQSSAGAAVRVYEIHVKGYLDSSWSEWLDGLDVKLSENGETVIFGPIVDQSALMGVLNKLARMSLSIISLSEVNAKNYQETKGNSPCLRKL